MAGRGIRGFMAELERQGELLRIRERLDPRFEISAVLDSFGQKEGPALFFENVQGYSVPVLGNIFGSRKRFATLFGVDESEFISAYLERKKGRITPVRTSQVSCKQHIITQGIDLSNLFPILTYHEKDVGPYITQGVIFLKNPVTGHRSMGVHRMQLRGKDALGVFVVSPASARVIRTAEETGTPVDVAVAIGVDPFILIASLARVDFADKLELAGALRGEPIEVVRAETVDIDVPAHAEIVLEGKIYPDSKMKDGPFGESTGFYISSESYTIKIEGITHRENPIYTVFQPWSMDDELMTSMIWGAEIYKDLKQKIPAVKDLRLTSNGAQAYISLEKRNDFDARQVLYYILSGNEIVKNAIVFDEDVDIYNSREVDWALSYRFQPSRDLVILSGLKGSPIDPSARMEDYASVTSKMGIDATVPSYDKSRFEKIEIPKQAKEKADRIVRGYKSRWKNI